MLLNSQLNILTPTNHTRRSPTKLHKILPNLLPIKHSIKGRDLVDSHGGYIYDFGDFVHCGEGEPTAGLTLSEIEEGDYT